MTAAWFIALGIVAAAGAIPFLGRVDERADGPLAALCAVLLFRVAVGGLNTVTSVPQRWAQVG